MRRPSGAALLITAAALLIAPVAFAQISPIPISSLPQYANSAGLGASYGPFLDRDADFWGVAVDYSRRLRKGWSIGGSLSFDRETDHSAGTSRSIDTLSAVAVVN